MCGAHMHASCARYRACIHVIITESHMHACAQVLKWHRTQQSQKSKEESARLNALRRQDYSEYLRLAQEAKAGRVQDAIDATERVMHVLTEKVCFYCATAAALTVP